MRKRGLITSMAAELQVSSPLKQSHQPPSLTNTFSNMALHFLSDHKEAFSYNFLNKILHIFLPSLQYLLAHPIVTSCFSQS